MYLCLKKAKEMNTTTRKSTTIRLPEYLLADLRTEARQKNTSVSRLIESIAEKSIYHPNAETLAAIEEAHSGVVMEELTPYDLEHFEDYVERL